MKKALMKIWADKANQVSMRNLVFIVGWSLLFTLAYAQSPLYSSNQNQYFLHGLAKAGVGFLNQDWLANTLDPTPVFSGLVTLTYRILPWPPIFHLYFGILAGIFLFSILGIASESLGLRASPSRRWLYLAVLTGVNSAALRYLAVRLTDVDWAYLFDGGVAGQRLLGPVLQPSAFGVFLLLSIYFFLKRKFTGALIFLVLAPTIHPTYLLSAALLTLIYMGILLAEKKEPRAPLALALAALIGVSPILWHTFATFSGSDPDLTSYARDLLVEFRIPHHAIPAEWFDGSVIIKVGFILLALLLLWTTQVTVTSQKKLFHILFWPSLAAGLGTVVQIVAGNNVLALLFPWRISTWLVPISVGLLSIWLTDRAGQWLEAKISGKIVIAVSLVAGLLLAGIGFSKSVLEYQKNQASADRPMMAFVAEQKSPGDVYLIPLDMQDFRLITGAPAYVEFKSIPYKDEDVKEWFRRVSLAGELYRAPYQRAACKVAARLAQEGVTHVILPYDHNAKGCSNLERLYVDFEAYEVFSLRAGSDQ